MSPRTTTITLTSPQFNALINAIDFHQVNLMDYSDRRSVTELRTLNNAAEKLIDAWHEVTRSRQRS